ncbi:hypothetical protein [Streptomyces sp. ME19-01-6]|uniref:hypothetical protein n=1 Tax=Streptomyces sp. ME19-01-6 TaxID=3028686 RepID=UPI0029A062E2|nr:hypothetical protein [Streptomyces sp. ME19-01-6]MDX3229185.1 hypothetical protein [Streptomyces sp. ME19-01-6]
MSVSELPRLRRRIRFSLCVGIVGAASYVIAQGAAAAGAGPLGTGAAGAMGIVFQRGRNQQQSIGQQEFRTLSAWH